MFRISLLSLLICGSAFAQSEVAGEPIPGQKVVQVGDYEVSSLTNLIRNIEAITGDGTVEIINSASRLGIFTLMWPVPDTDSEDEAIDDVFGDAMADGDIIQQQDNFVIDGTNGQTGSLWVSGPGIDRAAFSGSQYAIGQLELEQTHDEFSRGTGTLVAIVDTGIDPTHEVLAGHVSGYGKNTIIEGGETNDSGDGDHAGHGTFIAGLVHLVAPETLLLPITVLKGNGTGFPVDVADGISHAAQRGAHVIVLALGSEVSHFAMEEAIDDAIANGATVVAAAGNHHPEGENNCLFPANYNGLLGGTVGVIAVGGSNDLKEHSTISNYHLEVDLCAPCESYIDMNTEPDPLRSVIGPLPGNLYAAATGTSFSTAFAGGVAALIRAQHLDWPNETVPVDAIAAEIMQVIGNSSAYVEMPLVPSNPVDDKPLLNSHGATSSGPTLAPLGDLDGDGEVDGRDLATLLGGWGALPSNGSLHTADLVRNELVDGADLATLLGNWGAPAP